MNVSVHIEIASPEELALLAKAFAALNGEVVTTTTAKSEPIPQPAPAPKKTLAKPAVIEKPVEVEAEDDGVVEVVDKELVSKELRAFIGKNGAKEALRLLKEVGVESGKFEDLAPGDYSKFLSSLKKTA